jgi:hypothetical protein
MHAKSKQNKKPRSEKQNIQIAELYKEPEHKKM